MLEIFMVSTRKEEREKKNENPNKRSLAIGGGAKLLAHTPAVIQEIYVKKSYVHENIILFASMYVLSCSMVLKS